MTHIHDYASADAFLSQGRTARARQSRKVAHETYLIRDSYHDDDIGVVYHTTAVVIYHKDGTVTLDSGGWDTVTTFRRMRYYGGPVYRHRGHYYLYPSGRRSAAFHDGITIDKRGNVA